jgi:solute:Na+ symporter, SSS family
MEKTALTVFDAVIILFYLVFIIWLAARFSRRQKDTGRYFLADKKLPGWAVGISMFATIISSWSFVALPGKAFKNDLQYLMVISTLMLSAYLTAAFFIPLYRKKIKLSAYEFLEKRFGLTARIYGNLAFLIVHFGKMGAILYLLSLAVSSITGWDIYLLIAFIGAATIIYTYFGGIEGVVWSDVIQGFLLLASGIIALFFILYSAPFTAGEIFNHAYTGGKFKIISWEFSWEKTGFYVFVFFGFNYFFQKYVSDQTVVQRFLLSPTNKKAKNALWLSSSIIMIVWILFMSLGALLWAFYDLQPGLLPEAFYKQPDAVFPYFIGHQIPAGLTGRILSGLLAATMSTLSSDLNSLSAILLDDYYIKIRKNSTEKQQFIFSRTNVLISGGLAIILAMGMTEIKSMADAAANFVALIAGGILGLYLLGLFSKRCSPKGVYSGLAAGFIFVLWTYIGNQPGFHWGAIPLNTLWIGIFANVIVLITGYLSSRALTPGYFYDEEKLN